jgi:hypothetical protein
MSNSASKVWVLALVLVAVGMCFGAALFHWNRSKLHNCEGPFDLFGSNAIASEAGTVTVTAPALAQHGEPRLFSSQDQGNWGQ